MNTVPETITDAATPPVKPRLLTLKQAAELFDGLTEYRVKMLCTSGQIKYHRFGNKYMVSEKSVLEYFHGSV